MVELDFDSEFLRFREHCLHAFTLQRRALLHVLPLLGDLLRRLLLVVFFSLLLRKRLFASVLLSQMPDLVWVHLLNFANQLLQIICCEYLGCHFRNSSVCGITPHEWWVVFHWRIPRHGTLWKRLRIFGGDLAFLGTLGENIRNLYFNDS